jgi:hypothetical protein
MFIRASCHAPVSLSAVQGVFGGVICLAWSLRGDPQPLRASCHAPVSLSDVQGVSHGGYGRLPHVGSLRGDPHPLPFYYDNIHVSPEEPLGYGG